MGRSSSATSLEVCHRPRTGVRADDQECASARGSTPRRYLGIRALIAGVVPAKGFDVQTLWAPTEDRQAARLRKGVAANLSEQFSVRLLFFRTLARRASYNEGSGAHAAIEIALIGWCCRGSLATGLAGCEATNLSGEHTPPYWRLFWFCWRQQWLAATTRF
jgi:hypothetical protein